MSYEALEWDSAFFGFPIGRVPADADNLGAALSAADADGIRCLYLLCPADDDGTMAAALDVGFRPYDVRIEFERPLDSEPPRSEAHDARADDVPALERIARDRLQGTRFWADPRFPRDRVAELYVEWVRRGLATAPERRTLVVGEAEGFVICRLDRGRGVGTVELIAVAQNAEGRGIGARLLDAADAAFGEASLGRAEVVTQGRNLGAQRLYQRHGYRTARVGLWLHRWSDASR